MEEYGELPFIDDILATKPNELQEEAMDSERFQGANVIDRTNVIRGFDPRILQDMREEDDNDESADWDSDVKVPDEATADALGDKRH